MKACGIDITRTETHGNSENQSAVGDASSEFLSLTPLGIHMMRIEITALPGVQHDVGFGYSPAQSFASRTNLIIFKVFGLNHWLSPIAGLVAPTV